MSLSDRLERDVAHLEALGVTITLHDYDYARDTNLDYENRDDGIPLAVLHLDPHAHPICRTCRHHLACVVGQEPCRVHLALGNSFNIELQYEEEGTVRNDAFLGNRLPEDLKELLKGSMPAEEVPTLTGSVRWRALALPYFSMYFFDADDPYPVALSDDVEDIQALPTLPELYKALLKGAQQKVEILCN